MIKKRETFAYVTKNSYLCTKIPIDMNKKDKLLKRFMNMPRDFTFDEMEALFKSCGFTLNNKGATSGSRVEFVHEKDDKTYIMHKPHPSNIIKGYVMKQVYTYLDANGYFKQKED